jgi:hypothetical protein
MAAERTLPRRTSSARIAAMTLSCLLLASCDVFHGVRRRAAAPPLFDPVVAEAMLRRHPHFVAAEAIAWDGRSMWCPFRDGEAFAGIGYSPFEEYGGAGIAVDSLWVGSPPSADVLRSSLRLQNDLLAVLAAGFQDFPPLPAFRTEWVNMAPLRTEDLPDERSDWQMPEFDETWRISIRADALPCWLLQNANGDEAKTNVLRVVTDQTVQLLLLADRECTLEIPAFRIRIATVPDRYQAAFFTALEPGEYDVLVRCGADRYDGKLVAVAPHAR